MYANEEIKKNKKKYKIKFFVIMLVLILLTFLYFLIFKYEIPVKYNDKLIKVNIPDDGGIDIYVNLDNYEKVRAVLVKINDSEYDLYINVTSTLMKKVFVDSDKTDNFLRVGNGIIIDFNSGELSGYMPNGNKANSIKNIYYINNLSKNINSMDDAELIQYKEKILIWSR